MLTFNIVKEKNSVSLSITVDLVAEIRDFSWPIDDFHAQIISLAAFIIFVTSRIILLAVGRNLSNNIFQEGDFTVFSRNSALLPWILALVWNIVFVFTHFLLTYVTPPYIFSCLFSAFVKHCTNGLFQNLIQMYKQHDLNFFKEQKVGSGEILWAPDYTFIKIIEAHHYAAWLFFQNWFTIRKKIGVQIPFNPEHTELKYFTDF